MTIECYDFIVLYGTQTGQSQAIAESLVERAEQQHGLKTKISCLSLFEKSFNLEEEKFAVFIISSTGDGDSPESTLKFFRKLNRKTVAADHLANLQFALLGLGDTNYNNFCACPKRLEKRLLNLGAKPFYQSGFCDDAIGTELTAEPWIEGLFDALKNILNVKSMDCTSKTSSDISDSFKSLKLSTDYSSATNVGPEILCCTLTSKITNECRCVWPIPSIKHSLELKDISELKLPIVSQPFLKVTFSDFDSTEGIVDSIQNGAEFPSQHSKIMTATVVSRQQLTKFGSKKTKYAIFVNVEPVQDLRCEPGDALYFVCSNNDREVDWLLKRLNLNENASKNCSIDVLPETTKKNASVPAYIPSRSSTLRSMFTTCIDIRRPISRILLRILVDYCVDENEKRRLTELASNQGMNEFSNYARVNGLSLMDILHAFPSCSPPVERLIEHLPRLQPRPLSIASSTSSGQNAYRFVYSLVDIPAGQGRFYHRYGICTGLLTEIPLNSQLNVFMKKPTRFRLTHELSKNPVILVGPGTGVAPFIGFLENMSELESFKNDKILAQLLVCFSQSPQLDDDTVKPLRYVQENIRKHGEKLVGLLQHKEARIFVCGDAKHMANDVNQAFVDILTEHAGKSKEESVKFIMLLQSEFRYVQDVWT